mmetsp:Transcript_22479/g.38403  ORF Transcript_22479/g.38403 Transcript_22479/m.38403 type:complete len:105 (-) Transcript_22479:885-1199(-)
MLAPLLQSLLLVMVPGLLVPLLLLLLGLLVVLLLRPLMVLLLVHSLLMRLMLLVDLLVLLLLVDILQLIVPDGDPTAAAGPPNQHEFVHQHLHAVGPVLHHQAV